ncbi:hypothetical protein GIB67_006455, partial [Kingdonia uniflora]
MSYHIISSSLIIIPYHYSSSPNSYLYSSILITCYLDLNHLVYYSFTLKLSLSHLPHPL